jgi:biopolymer transport protein ExbD
MNLGSRNKVKVEGGMASMTDLVFLLLIFFIIMATMTNPTARVDVPEDSTLPPETDHVDPTVVITEDNLYYVLPGGSPEDLRQFEDIQAEAQAAVAESNKLKLKIEGHRKADYEAVFKVMAMAQINGWDPVLAYQR